MSIPTHDLNALKQRIDSCQITDRFKLQRKLAALSKLVEQQQPYDRSYQKLIQAIDRSEAISEHKLRNKPTVTFPNELPVCERQQEIGEIINNHQVVIIAGETGSGKTTQIPKICLALGRGIYGKIGHTQPRRLAASSVASRIAEELGTTLGEGVGYQVRFSDKSSPRSYIKLMTDGILLTETRQDRFLNQYDTIIVDEAHERSLNIDFLLGYLKQLLPKRPDLKVIVTSATIDVEKFSQHFDGAPIVQVSGRTYPVEVVYRPIDSDENDLSQAIVANVKDIIASDQQPRDSGGDILVFLSGERGIREVALALRKAQLRGLEILPLYARLSSSEQTKIFRPNGRGRRVILATNVAETSLTVPGISYVIDPGDARISRYSYRTKVQRLPIEPISQASANQRKGRCGRISEGVCVRLYTEEDFLNRPAFTDAEILRTNLASVILQMLSLKLGDINKFPFVDKPDRRLVNDGIKLLEELGALSATHKISSLGQQLSLLPVDPRLGRMVIAAADLGCLQEVIIIVSGLSVQDPRERPADKQQAADEKHRAYWDERSDFLAMLNLWNSFEAQRQALSQNQLRKYCQRHFLSLLKMREWRDVHHQLKLAARQMQLCENQLPAEYDAIHKALLSGLLGSIGVKDTEREYSGARNRKFFIFPGSSLFKKQPKWLVAAELVETTKLYARTVAGIQPDWVLTFADHLIKRHYYEPHWSKKQGQALAYERVSLYGLVIVDRHRVSYGKIDPLVARELFIRHGLVQGDTSIKASFLHHNQMRIAEVQALESKIRSRDILVDDLVLYQFYDERIPQHVVNVASFEKWRKRAERDNPDLLKFPSELLMLRQAEEANEQQFPQMLTWQGLQLPLKYHFEPGHRDDGVTVTIPIAALNQVPSELFQWLVPGMLRDKCIVLMKSLPKPIRKQFVPVPNYVDSVLAKVKPDNIALTKVLAEELKKINGTIVTEADWQLQNLEDYYKMNFHLLDDQSEVVGVGRDLEQLKEKFGAAQQNSFHHIGTADYEQHGLTDWQIGELPELYEFEQAGLQVRAYPALEDKHGSVSLVLKDTKQEALGVTLSGIVRLLTLRLGQKTRYLKKNLLTTKDVILQCTQLGGKDRLLDDLIRAAFRRAFIPSEEQLPRSHQKFEACIDKGNAQLIDVAQALEADLRVALDYRQQIVRQIKGTHSLAFTQAYGDIKAQLTALFCDGFIYQSPVQGCGGIQHYERYLKAIQMRLEKLPSQLQKDKQAIDRLHAVTEPLTQLLQNNGKCLTMLTPFDRYRWLLEEYRVSLFAQQLGTIEPISEKRLKKHWQSLTESR